MARLVTIAALLSVARLATAQTMPPGVQALTAGFSSTCAPTTCVTWAMGTAPVVTLTVTGTFSGTITWEGSSDGGQTYTVLNMVNLADGTSSSTTTATGKFSIPNSGLTHVQARMTTYVSGGANVLAIRGFASAKLIPFSSGGGPLRVSDGTCAAPAYSFLSDTTQGLAKGCLFLAQGTIAADSQTLSTTGTWNNAAIAFTHWKAVITDTASATGSLAVSVKGGAAGTTNLFSVSKSGAVIIPDSITVGAFAITQSNGFLGWSGTSRIYSPSDGVVELLNAAGTDFSRLQGGGTTSAFPSWKRSGTGWISRLADDSANGPVTASFYNSSTISALTVTTNTIAPTGAIHQLGAGLIKTITVPTSCTPTCTLYLEPTAAFTYDATGNILVPSGGGTAVISKLMVLIWNGTKWVPSY